MKNIKSALFLVSIILTQLFFSLRSYSDTNCKIDQKWKVTGRPSSEFARVKPLLGEVFWVGSELGNWGYRPAEKFFKVTFTKTFEIMTHEITQEQFAHIMGYNPSQFSSQQYCLGNWKQLRKNGQIVSVCPNLPVDSVSWNEVKQLISKLNSKSKGRYTYDLPTEAQWEYVATAPTDRQLLNPFSFFKNSFAAPGSELLKDYAAYELDAPEEVCAKNQTPGAVNIWDLHGNQWEWVKDCYDSRMELNQQEVYQDYEAGCVDQSDRVLRVIKGGSWDSSPINLRRSARMGGAESRGSEFVGVRLVRYKNN